MKPPVVTGGIYLVDDRVINLPPEDNRNFHTTRRSFVVLSGPDANSDPQWPIVFGCPLSSSTSWRSRFDVKLSAGEGNVSKKVWVRVAQAQPIRKIDLQDHTGVLPGVRLEEVHTRLFWYMGLISFDEKPEDPIF